GWCTNGAVIPCTEPNIACWRKFTFDLIRIGRVASTIIRIAITAGDRKVIYPTVPGNRHAKFREELFHVERTIVRKCWCTLTSKNTGLESYVRLELKTLFAVFSSKDNTKTLVSPR